MKSSIFTHKNGGLVDLPLLVPSFSSKGFRFSDEKEKGRKTETNVVLQSMGHCLEESFLISAFDIFHEHYDDPCQFVKDTSLLFIDSGGYELNPEFDSCEPKITPMLELEFTPENYELVLDRMYKDFEQSPLLIANFDWATKGRPYQEQISAARKLFHKYPGWSNNFILKPQARGIVIQPEQVGAVAKDLRGFDVIGVTEKELGKGLPQRLACLSELRSRLWDSKVWAPIHVWGGMDPLVTPLYFFAGADIFDGVSWLRYTYEHGLAISKDGGPILRGEITTPYDHSTALTRFGNLTQLQGLATALRLFSSTEEPNFDHFDEQSKVMKQAYEKMQAKSWVVSRR